MKTIEEILTDSRYLADASRPPFLTGSRAYGTPRHDSDFDFVVMGDGADFLALPGATTGGSGESSVRFGCINFIICGNARHYDDWKEGTEILNAIAPVTREHAVQLFQSLFKRPAT